MSSKASGRSLGRSLAQGFELQMETNMRNHRAMRFGYVRVIGQERISRYCQPPHGIDM